MISTLSMGGIGQRRMAYAVQTQLGLKLVAAQGEYEMLVFDHADRALTAN